MRDVRPHNQIARFGCRAVSLLLSLCLAVVLAACDREETDAPRIADYGPSGRVFAETLAREYPTRYAGSEQEREAAVFISERLAALGYEVERLPFTYQDEHGTHESQNVVAHLPGNGFVYAPRFEHMRDESLAATRDELHLIIGAHYDTPRPRSAETTEEGAGESAHGDGIHNNASGVAAVFTAARILRDVTPGYHVDLIFFGAGCPGYHGATAYLESLSDAERAAVDAMVNVGPIYAGDKVYAHAGQNSVMAGDMKNYDMRRKLYQVTDIFFDYTLNTHNGYAIYTNQSNLKVSFGDGEAEYREWSLHTSDHTPFDRAGIPVVFLESGDYRGERVEETGIESRNPRFSEQKGMISGTAYDETAFLETFFRTIEEEAVRETLPLIEATDPTPSAEEGTVSTTAAVKRPKDDRLTQRINNTAFVLVQLTRRGPLDYEYQDN